MKVNLGGVQETLLIPLWSRAKLAKENNSILVDLRAIDIVEKLQYDFSKIDKYFPYFLHVVNLVRAKMLENIINEYLLNHPRATIINLGAGLDTTFCRVDNGVLNWYDIDLPDVMEIRKKLIPETDRSRYIEESIFEMEWIESIDGIRDGLLFISGGVLEYFDKNVVKKFFSDLADHFPESEIAFNAIRNNTISSIFNYRLMRQLGMKSATMKWKFSSPEKIKRWDKRIVILEQYPIFSKINTEKNWNKKVIRTMKLYDRHKIINIVHLKFMK
jgi:O-methyltransferase involved in polyketide biosynthesis